MQVPALPEDAAQQVQLLSSLVHRHLSVDRLMELASPYPTMTKSTANQYQTLPKELAAGPKPRLAVAQDEVFGCSFAE